MAYTVLARRYRSETFDEVIGQEVISKTLTNAINLDRVAHAYLFTGTRGVGKTTMARIFAKALNCLNSDKPTTTPCNACESCELIAEGNDIDVIEIDAASNTGVEHIRQLRDNAIFRPARARFKIYIIDEVHMLSVSAFNALLKTLEEPPEHVKFILATTESNKILPTILSRCQRFDFRNIQPADIAKQIQTILKNEKIKAEDQLVQRLARLANGSMRDALSLLDPLLSVGEKTLTLEMLNQLLGTPRNEMIIELVDQICQQNLSNALVHLDKAIGEGLGLEVIAQKLQEHFRDLLILCQCGKETELVDLDDNDLRETFLQQSQKFDVPSLVYNITVMEELRRAIKTTGAGRALLEAAIVRLSATEQFSNTSSLIDKLHQLQTGTTAPARNHPQAMQARQVPQGQHIKKNSPSPVNSDTPHGQSPQTPTSNINVPNDFDINYLKKSWPTIVAQFSNFDAKSVQVAIKPSIPTKWDQGILTLGFPSASQNMYHFLSSQAAKLEEAQSILAKILKTSIKCELILTAPQEQQQMDKPQDHVPGAKLSQKEIRSAMMSPEVRKIQEVLGGSIKNIKKAESI